MIGIRWQAREEPLMGSCGCMVRSFVYDPLGQPGRALLALWHRGHPLLPLHHTGAGLAVSALGQGPAGQGRKGLCRANQTNSNGGNKSHTLSGQILLGSSEPLGQNCKSCRVRAEEESRSPYRANHKPG